MSKTFVYPFIKTGEVYRPFIPIIINNPIDNANINVMALLDTGADASVFPKFVAENTKHNLKGDGVVCNVSQGIGSMSVDTWQHTFRICLVAPDKKTVVWKSKSCLVNCLEHDNAPPLLGFTNFLAFFRITFNYETKKIVIEIP